MVDIDDGDRLVPWEEARKVNLANWNDRARIHRRSYGLERYLSDPTYLSCEVRKDLPLLVEYSGRDSLHGATIAHLQCHIGTDTVSLARLGAAVTGLDFSPAALKVAAQLAHDCGLNVRWVEADVMEAARAIGHQVDIVYTSIGTICWLADLDRWAVQIAELVAPGGIFLIRDGHPMAYSSDWVDDRLEIRHRYFPNGRAQVWDTTRLPAIRERRVSRPPATTSSRTPCPRSSAPCWAPAFAWSIVRKAGNCLGSCSRSWKRAKTGSGGCPSASEGPCH